MQRSHVLVALAIMGMLSTLAMGATGTWTGADSATPTAYGDAGNWVGGTIPRNVNVDTAVFDNADAGANNLIEGGYFTGNYYTIGNIIDNYTGTFTIQNMGQFGGAVSVATGCTLNINWAPSSTSFNNTFFAAAGATLNLTDILYIGQATFSGQGTMTFCTNRTNDWYSPLNSINLAGTSNVVGNAGTVTLNLTETQAYDFWSNLTGTGILNISAAYGNNYSGATILGGSPAANGPATFSSTVQINVQGGGGFDGNQAANLGANRVMFYTNNGANEINGAQVCLQGGDLHSYGENGTWDKNAQTFTNCNFSGNGTMFFVSTAYDGNGMANSAVTLVAKGTTFQPTVQAYSFSDTTNGGPTGLFGTTGKLAVDGNLQFAKSGTTPSTVSINVRDTLGNPGTSFGVLQVVSMRNGGGNISSASSATNALADANLVINITPGLTPKGVLINGDPTNTSNPFFGQTMEVVEAWSTDLTNASFNKVTITGGSATVSYGIDSATGHGVVTLSNVWSNPTLAGDINNDGLVDVADYNIWAANVGKTGATWGQGDLNGDGLVDVADYNIWAANVGKTSATPEPISMIILAIGGGLVALKRRK